MFELTIGWVELVASILIVMAALVIPFAGVVAVAAWVRRLNRR